MNSVTQSLNFTQKFSNLMGTMHFIKFINDPSKTETIFDMADSFQKASPSDLIEKIIQPFLKNSRLASDYENKVWYSHPSMKILSLYPEGSFGKLAADFFIKNNLDENLFPKANYNSLVDYITSRIYQTHDFWHVLTDYSIDLEDELALQAFAIGQYQQPINLTIIAGGVIHILQHHPERTFEIMNCLTEGYQRGLQSEFLLDKNIFDYLDKPICKVREHFKIPNRSPSIKHKEHISA
jgi:ubiquinone biosynthesis protein COQ4